MGERITKKDLEKKFLEFKAQAENDGYSTDEWELRLGSGTQGTSYGFRYRTGLFLTLGKTAKEAFTALSFMLDGWQLRGFTKPEQPLVNNSVDENAAYAKRKNRKSRLDGRPVTEQLKDLLRLDG